MKATRDAVAEWLAVDDRDPRVGFAVEQAPGAYSVRIVVASKSAG